MHATPLLMYVVLALVPRLPECAVARLGAPARANIQGYHLAFSQDGKYLAEGLHPPAVWVWEIATGKRVHAFSTGPKTIGALCFSSDGRVIVELIQDPSNGRLVVFDVPSEKKIRSLDVPGGHPLTISPDGKWAAFWHSTYVKNDPLYFISLWDVETGKHVRDLAKSYIVRHARFSRDGKTLVVAAYEHGIRSFEVATSKEIAVYRGKPEERALVHWPILAPDGRRALLWSNPARLVDLWREDDGEALCQHAGSFNHVIFSGDGNKLVATSHDGSIRLWDVNEKRELPPLLDEYHYYATLVFSPDNRLLAAANGPRSPRVWDLRTGVMLPGFDGHLKRVVDLTYSPDGQLLASYSQESARVFLWNTSSRKIVHVLGELGATYSHLRFSRDGSHLAACHGRKKTVVIWDTKTGKEQLRLPEHTRWIATFLFLPDGKTMLTAGGDVLRWFDLSNGKETRRLKGIAVSANRTAGLIQHLQSDSLNGPALGYADFSPDGRRFASVTLEGGHWLYGNATAWLQGGKYVLRLWDTETGKAVEQRELAGNSFPRYSIDGKDLLVSGMALQILNPLTGKETARNDKIPPSARQLVLSPDRRWVFSGRHHAAKGDVVGQMWDAKTGKPAPLPDAGQGLVTATAISPTGKRLATGGADGTIVIWDAERLANRLDQK